MIRRPKVPLRITLLLGLVLIITVLSTVRLATAIAWRSVMATYMPDTLIFYIGLTGAIWTITGCFVLWTIWRRARYTQALLLASAVTYALWGWLDRLLLQASARSNWLFQLIGTILLLVFVGVVVLDPRNRPYFRKESHDRKPESTASS